MDCLVTGFTFNLVGNTLGFLGLHLGMLETYRRQAKKNDPNAWKTLRRLGRLSTQVEFERTFKRTRNWGEGGGARTRVTRHGPASQ